MQRVFVSFQTNPMFDRHAWVITHVLKKRICFECDFSYFPMRFLPFLGGADEVILDVCMSSPMYLEWWVSLL